MTIEFEQKKQKRKWSTCRNKTKNDNFQNFLAFFSDKHTHTGNTLYYCHHHRYPSFQTTTTAAEK